MKLLIVEDEKKTGEYLTKGLTEAGFVVDLADNGLNGYHLAMTGDYDLIILDIMLPDVNGWDIVRMLRSANKGMPILLLTALGTIEHRVKGLELGADDYLVKPFDILELLVRMEKVLARSDRQPKQLIYRDIAVDLESRSVTKGGEMITLKNMEYELLLTFLRHPGMVMTREDLLHQVWGDEFIGETRTVDVHVAALRRKLDLNKELVTVYKIGYRLEVKA